LESSLFFDGYIYRAAAKEAGIPSIIISNFTFDAVYSYLSAAGMVEKDFVKDEKSIVKNEEVNPLAQIVLQDYRKADLLLRLPGRIPIPSFDFTLFPATDWVDLENQDFTNPIMNTLDQDVVKFTKPIIDVGLIVRPLSKGVETREFRQSLLTSIGIPLEEQDPVTTKILLVSFGGQSIPKPRSRLGTPTLKPIDHPSRKPSTHLTPSLDSSKRTHPFFSGLSNETDPTGLATPNLPTPKVLKPTTLELPVNAFLDLNEGGGRMSPLSLSPIVPSKQLPELDVDLLPEGWIAVVCGSGEGHELKKDLPSRFYVCSKEVYVPDLTRVADVVMGKLVSG
jgi:hypothetical protein